MYLENSGEVLPKFYLRYEWIMEADRIYAWSGGIRTYLHLLESRANVYMHLILTVVADIFEDG